MTSSPSHGLGTVQFPTGFLWGAATAAFQIEGSTTSDGRTDSIWDAFARKPGAVANGDTGEPACDHYRRMPQDVELMAELGLRSYRFSTSWARIRPDGGPVNQAGLDFYSRLVDELLGHGIKPWLTLYHWDLPQALQDAGGWTNRDTTDRFAEYAMTVHDALGDRVPTWTTLNEPWCSSLLSYSAGLHAPGHTDQREGVAAVHHLLLAHGKATQALRGAGVGSVTPTGEQTELGITLNLSPVAPADRTREEDVTIARRVDGLMNRVFLDPLLRGGYPKDVWDDLEPFGLAEVVQPGDLDVIATPIDVLGVNYYQTTNVRDAGAPVPHSPWVGAESAEEVSRGLAVTAMGWEIDADGLRDLLVSLKHTYPCIPPIVITENGAAFDDEVAPDGSIHDEDRRSYLEDHLRACAAALTEGVDLRGYLAWSLMDNFEWAYGYEKRFGLVRVDYDTQKRTPKASAHWYSQVIRGNGF